MKIEDQPHVRWARFTTNKCIFIPMLTKVKVGYKDYAELKKTMPITMTKVICDDKKKYGFKLV